MGVDLHEPLVPVAGVGALVTLHLHLGLEPASQAVIPPYHGVPHARYLPLQHHITGQVPPCQVPPYQVHTIYYTGARYIPCEPGRRARAALAGSRALQHPRPEYLMGTGEENNEEKEMKEMEDKKKKNVKK